MTLQLFNTETRRKEDFAPINAAGVKLYCCGPTVYNYAHIGNLRTYIFEDLLRRTLARNKYDLTHVMNVTDVGHLQSDADEGEDKMQIAQKRENKSPWDIAKFYEEAFFEDCKKLGILKPHIVCRATDHIAEMIAMIETLMAKGYAYQAGGNTQNVYFDTAKFADYKKFARLVDDPDAQNRVDADSNKRNPADFVLWFTLAGSKYPNQIMKWPSPWGEGFPGWHIECSAMATKYLGEHIDIHCGGIDHIPVHHTNEIAQSECCLGHKWVKTWLHGAFLTVDEGRMAKSGGNFLTLQKLIDDGYSPAHYRYLCLTAHYRGELRFSYDSLDVARTSYDTLCHKADEWRGKGIVPNPGAAAKEAVKKIDAAMADDLNAPVALSHLWEAMRSDTLTPADQLYILDAADSALGMGGVTLIPHPLTDEQVELLHLRDKARREKNWPEADRIRSILAEQAVILKDRPEGTSYYKDREVVFRIIGEAHDYWRKNDMENFERLKVKISKTGAKARYEEIDGIRHISWNF